MSCYCDLTSAVSSRTDEDEGQSDDEGQDVSSEGLVVLAVAFGENAQAGVDVVLTQSLWTDRTECCEKVSIRRSIVTIRSETIFYFKVYIQSWVAH